MGGVAQSMVWSQTITCPNTPPVSGVNTIILQPLNRVRASRSHKYQTRSTASVPRQAAEKKQEQEVSASGCCVLLGHLRHLFFFPFFAFRRKTQKNEASWRRRSSSIFIFLPRGHGLSREGFARSRVCGTATAEWLLQIASSVWIRRVVSLKMISLF